ncbi:multifunctional nuclease [Saccharomycopsis crataegensis]|uniref:Flap endonuclease 1 n=1 Tax=Saccharomycopsis crataegensis TaxID=43959 RepID=A0AAV5QUM5_9ASCO|nr:multifunctional nuclease [Saccharomycopsis crataegensis]
MGIKGLNRLIADNVPSAIKSAEMKTFFGRKVAIDASMCLYQYLIAVRQSDGSQLTNEEGQTTSHLSGFFYRTIRMVENGLKPMYVFDGKPPELKAHELTKRTERKKAAEAEIEKIKETASAEELSKFQRRTVRATREQNEEVKELLKLMGIPYVEAPCEAEAQCAELASAGKVYAAASEDMDTLCYGPPYLLRHLTYAESRKIPIDEVAAGTVVEGLELTRESFIDLCILLGCDYCETIKGIGPVNALKLIKEHGSIEKILQVMEENPTKYAKNVVPEGWLYKEARQLFLKPEVIDGSTIDLKWNQPDLEGLIKFMCEKNGFSEERIKNGAAKLSKGAKSGVQGRLDSFFKVKAGSATKSPAVKKAAASSKVTKTKVKTSFRKGKR